MMRGPLTTHLEKRAGVLGSTARFLGNSAVRTGMIGSGVGAALNVAKERSSGKPNKNYVRAAIHGGVAGGALGAAGHSVVRRGLDAALAARSKGKVLTAGGALAGAAKSYGTSLKDFGRRQIHGFTGTMGDSLTSGLKREQSALRLRHADAFRRGSKSEASRILSTLGERNAELARKNEALRAGVTSLPGVASRALESPRQLGKDLWKHNVGAGAMATGMAALPAAMAAGDIAVHGDESAHGGLTRKQKAIKGVAQTAGGVLAGGMPFVPGMLAWDAAEKSVQHWTKPKAKSGQGKT